MLKVFDKGNKDDDSNTLQSPCKLISFPYDYAFSVIVPIYNTEKYLEETIESIINQTIGFRDNIELILVNNGSLGDPSVICKKYMQKYPDNIKYVALDNNIGPNGARNKGLEL